MNLIAVTSCPTGIAHSQMAAEQLEQTAAEQGHEISVEVQGAMGTQDELSAEEIAAADAVIIAADTSVKTDRFDGIPLVKGTVKDAVNDADGLIQQAVERGGGDSAAAAEAGSASESDTATTAEAGTETGTDADSSATASAGRDEPTEQESPTRRGGDRSKGLFARLKRLFS